jgi:hypothetical protein
MGGGYVCIGGGVSRGRADGDRHEHCRCACKMARARFYRVWRRRGRRQTADGKRQRSSMPAGVNYVACLCREILGCCHAGRRCSRRSCALSLARVPVLGADSTPPTRASVAAWAQWHAPDKTKTKTETKTWPVPDSTDASIHSPTVRCLSRFVKMLQSSTSPLAPSPHVYSTRPSSRRYPISTHRNRLSRICRPTYPLVQPTMRPAESRKLWPGVLHITIIGKLMQPHRGADLQLRL